MNLDLDLDHIVMVQTEKIQKIYKTGERCESGETVGMVLGQSKRAAVFTTKDGQLRHEDVWSDSDYVDERFEALSRFNQLMSEISAFVPQKSKKPIYHQLGKALHSVLDSPNLERVDRVFGPIAETVHRHGLSSARFTYVVTALVITFVSSLILGLLLFNLRQDPVEVYVIGTLAGVYGALVSVLIRSSALDLDWSHPPKHFILQAVSRSLLGIIFGVFLVVAIQSGLALSFLSGDEAGMAVFCFFAGFSERFVPEVLERINWTGTS